MARASCYKFSSALWRHNRPVALTSESNGIHFKKLKVEVPVPKKHLVIKVLSGLETTIDLAPYYMCTRPSPRKLSSPGESKFLRSQGHIWAPPKSSAIFFSFQNQRPFTCEGVSLSDHKYAQRVVWSICNKAQLVVKIRLCMMLLTVPRAASGTPQVRLAWARSSLNLIRAKLVWSIAMAIHHVHCRELVQKATYIMLKTRDLATTLCYYLLVLPLSLLLLVYWLPRICARRTTPSSRIAPCTAESRQRRRTDSNHELQSQIPNHPTDT